MLRHSLSDADRDRITATVEQRAEFEPGDRVTVEPSDTDIAHVGEDLEGAPLVIEEVVWRDLDTTTNPAGEANRYESVDESEYVELDADDWATDETVYGRASKIEYRFQNERAPVMGEFGLIPWDEYREDHDRVTIYPEKGKFHSDNEKKWLEPFEDGPCEVCGCNMARHWYYSDGHNAAGGHECAACGEVFEQSHP